MKSGITPSLAIFAGLLSLTTVAVSAQDSPSYRNQAAPILQKYCGACHNSATSEGGLSLLSAAAIQKGSTDGPVISMEKPAESRLLQVIESTGDDHMPPQDEPQPSQEDIAVLKAWILAGAKFDGVGSTRLLVPKLPPARGSSSPVLSLAARNDGTHIAVGTTGQIQLLPTDKFPSIPFDGKITDIRFSPTGQLIVATGVPGLTGRAMLFESESGKFVREFGGHEDLIYAATLSPDGSLVATAGYDRKIILHNFQDGSLVRELAGHNGAIFDLAFSPDGSLLASASADATVKVWNVATGERFDTLSQPLSEQYTVLFSPDGQFLYASGADSRIRKWKVVSKTAAAINPILESRFAHEGTIAAMALSPDGRFLATAAEDGSWKIWNSETLRELISERRSEDTITALAFLDNNRLVTGTSRGESLIVDVPGIPSESPTVASTANPPVIPTTPSTAPQVIQEQEPNSLENAQIIALPASVQGIIHSEPPAAGDAAGSSGEVLPTTDADTYRFALKAGERLVLEVKAQRDKSPLDSRIEVLTADGKPVLNKKLQAVRDSYFTFRGKDSTTSDDFRMFNWQEMELNEYLYADGEVVRLWLYPRGPDSGFKVYPGYGDRYTFFGTTATSHALQAPAFIVVPREPNEPIVENGLPVFPVYFENDDDPIREWGSDSRLFFTAPADGEYIARITDARGFSGAEFRYELTMRPPQEDFSVAMGGEKVSIFPGTSREISFTAKRIDGYSGPIEIYAEGLPAGFSASLPTEIQADQQQAFVAVIADETATQPSDEAIRAIKFFGRAEINGQQVVHEIGSLAELKLQEKPKIRLTIHSADQEQSGQWQHVPELTVYAGETTRAFIRAQRHEFNGNIELGHEAAGRNMPHGVFVDNIGLNGLMILEGQDQREFFITVARWVPETSRLFYISSNIDGIASTPVMLHIRHR